MLHLLPVQNGWTALMAASRSNQPKIIQMLLIEGADPDLQGEVSFPTRTRMTLVHS